MFYINICR